MTGKRIGSDSVSTVSAKVSEKNQDESKDPMALLEEALEICKMGRFHIKLMFATLASAFSYILINSTTSFILPVAECDLRMTIFQKGLLTSMPFVGQIGLCSCVGFLTDTFGRKKSLIFGLLGGFLCILIQGSSQNFAMLAAAKLFEGIFSTFSGSTTAVMLAEFVHKGIRDRVLLLYLTFLSFPQICIALVSWAMLTQKWDFNLIDGYFELHSWNIYIYFCSIFNLIGGVSYCFLPESPKFLLTHGRENEALDVLKDIYVLNTGKDRKSFPITTLNTKGTFVSQTKVSIRKKMTTALFEVKHLLRKPLFGRLVLFSSILFVSMIVASTFRLWFPQISTIVENYEKGHNKSDWFCVMITDYTNSLNTLSQKSVNESNLHVNLEINGTQPCIPKLSGSRTYTNSIILGCMSLTCTLTSTFIVGFLGHKTLMLLYFIFSATCSTALYWTNSQLAIAILISIACGLMHGNLSLQNNMFVRAFPTPLRSLTTAIIFSFGRIGSLLGSILFPIMLTYGCMLPFGVMAGMILCVASLVFFLPNLNNGSGGDK